MHLRGRSLQYFVFCAGSFTALLCGLHLGWPSPSLPKLLSNKSTIPLTNSEGSWVASIFLVGGMCSSILLALTLDLIGRRKMLLITALPLFATWLMIAFASSPVELYVARFLAGISDGLIFSCLPLYLAEICDSEIRGFLISNINVVYLIGTYLANLLGSFFSITAVALLSSGLSFGAILLSLFIPESPHFYLIKGDVTRARIAIEKFSEDGNVDDSFDSIQEGLKDQKESKGNWLHLFTDASNRKSICVVIFLRVFQLFSGFIGIVFYAQTLFEKAAEDVRPIVFVTVFYLLQITCSIINATIIDKLGRRTLLILSQSTVTVALCVLTTYFTLENLSPIHVTDYSWLPVFGLLLFVVGYTLGLHTIPIILGGEIFPLHVKAFATSISSICFGLFGTAVSKFFQYTKDEFGIHVPFIAFTICSMCGLPFVIFCVPETKGRTLAEIQGQRKSKKNIEVHDLQLIN